MTRAIRRLQHGRAADHTGLQSEHFIYAVDTLAPILAHLFNRALTEGLPAEWTMHTIVPIHKAGDQLDPSNYRTIMIGHTLAKLYEAVLEEELSSYAEHEGLRAPGQAGFRRAFSTTDHIFTLRCLIDQARTQKKRLYCCFVDFRKAFDTIPRERLFQRLQSLKVPSEMMWGIYALYEQVFGRVRCPGGISDTIASTIGVKQGCPLSPTLFGLYIDEIADFLTRDGGGAVDLSGTPVHIMLYADDIVLVSESQGGLQRHLQVLEDFCMQRGLTVNLGKTKVMIFHTSRQGMAHASFTFAGGPVEIVTSYVYLGVTFSTAATHFTMGSAAQDRLTRGYAALAMLERRCHQAHFQEPRTKGWLFDSLVTPSLMYAAAVWGPGLATQWWTQLERPQIIMFSRLIRSKPSVPHDILRAEFATPPMLVEALFQTICFLHRFREMPHTHLSYRAFETSRALAEAGDRGCWYAQVTDWFTQHGLDIDRLPPFQYDMDAPHLHLSHSERNRVMRQDLWQLYIRRTWISPQRPLPAKMLYYRDHFMSISDDGFIRRPRYLEAFLPHSTQVAMGQLRVSSHRLEIETGRAAHIPREGRICRLCRVEVESEEHFVCRCSTYSTIRERYPSLFREHHTLQELFERADQHRLGAFLLEIQRQRERALQEPITQRGGLQQTRLTDYFQRSTLGATIRLGVSLERAERLRSRRRTRAPGFQLPRLHCREIAEIRQRHQREREDRVAQLRADPTRFIRELHSPPSLLDTLLYPHIDTGWR